ncbi:MAG: GNAT family N-acetyltransferase [Bdellovibrionales bacterium]
MSEVIAIRPWDVKDQADIYRLLLDLQAYEVMLHPTRRNWTEQDAVSYWETVKPRLSKQEGICLVAEVDGRVVGFSLGWIENDVFEMKVHPHEARYAFLSEGFVFPEFRRGKVFSQLVHGMEEHFYNLGIRRIRRESFANNSSLLAAANAQGYQLYEITLEKVL